MPKGSEELTQARKAEIISACAELYETMNFKDVTLKDIGAKTSFTRTLIYYYFHTKEEIFLALLQREYEAWIEDLHEIRMSCRRMTVSQFADALARSLERRSRLLKLMSMNHYDDGGKQPDGKSRGLQGRLWKLHPGGHPLPGAVFPADDRC